MITIAGYNCATRLPFTGPLASLVVAGKKTRTIRFCPKGIDPDGRVPYQTITRARWGQATPSGPFNHGRRRFHLGDYAYLQEPLYWGYAIYTGDLKVARYTADRYLCKEFTPIRSRAVEWTYKPDELPAMNMGSRFARTILQIKDVKFEMLGDMTDADAMAEGVQKHNDRCWRMPGALRNTPLKVFATYWDTLTQTKAERWEAMQGKLVRVITFEVAATAKTPWDLARGATK